MGFPPTQKTLDGLLKDQEQRLVLVERRLAVGGGGSGEAPYDAQPGMVMPFAGTTLPTGWLLADGSVVSRTQYPKLFGVIGTTYGAGDGSTTFGLPNYKGRTLVGKDGAQVEFDTLGETGGAKVHTLTVAEMPTHTHGIVTRVGIDDQNWTFNGGVSSDINTAGPAFATNPEGGGTAHNNLQPYAVANYIISTGEGSVGGGGIVTVAAGDTSPVKPGMIMPYAGATAPTGWLLCDGAAVSRATYGDLFVAIGTAYGAGDGSTTFNVPNLKGKVPVGYDSSQAEFNAMAKAGGEKAHVLSIAELPDHSHGQFVTANPGSGGAARIDYDQDGAGSAYPQGVNTGGMGGQSLAHNNLQPYTVTNYIIAYASSGSGGGGGTTVPATETVAGIAEIATQPETDTGTDDTRFVTPKKLASRLAAIPSVSNLIDAKGDLIVGTADNTPARLPIGADALVLTADAAQPTGMKWAPGGSGGGGGDIPTTPTVLHPVGDIWQVTNGVAPTDTLLADGRAVSRTTYAELFAKIGTTYGRGDGSTTFNLPNLNGREIMIPNEAPTTRWNLSNVFVPLSAAEGNAGVPDTYEIRAQMTASANPRIRFSTGGVDNSAAAYIFAREFLTNAALTRSNDTATMIYLGTETAPRQTLNMIVQRAGAADYTDFSWDQTHRNSSQSPAMVTGVGSFQANTAFDGITIFSETAAMSGWLQVIPFGGSMVPSVIATKAITATVLASPLYDSVAGMVMPYAGGTVPSGWLLCDGSLVSRSAYPKLFTAIGTTYGAGDGSTTFGLPNYKGRTLVRRDAAQTEFDVLGEVGGAKAHTLTVAEMPAHNHTMPADAWINTGQYATPNTAGHTFKLGGGNTGDAGGGTAHNNLQPYAVANWIISTGSGVGGGGSSVPALPSPVTAFSTVDSYPITAAVGVWQDIPGAAVTLTLANPAWVAVNFDGELMTADAGTQVMVGVAATGALTLLPEQDQASGATGKWGLASYIQTETGHTIPASGTKMMLVPAGTTTLKMQMRRAVGSGTPTIALPVLTVTPLSWAGAPGASQNMTRGTTAQRDAVFGVPATDAERAALANQVVEWFNTDRGWTELYYATAGTAGLAKPGLRSGFAAGWYPQAGSPIYATVRRGAAQAVGASQTLDIGFDQVLSQHGFTTLLPAPVIIPYGGDYEITLAAVGSQAAGQFFNLSWMRNGVEQWLESGSVFPHTAAYSRSILEPTINPLVAGDSVNMRVFFASVGSVAANSARMTLKYISPPFAP